MKHLLTEERVPATSAMARFVGVDAYEAAGGPVLRDLLAAEDESSIWFEDPVLLNNLAMAKLGETVKGLTTRWHWVTAMPEDDWTSIARYGRIYPKPAMSTRRRFMGEFKAKMARMKEVFTKGAERSRGDHEGEIRNLYAKVGELPEPGTGWQGVPFSACLVWCLTNTLMNLRVLLAVGCVALPRVVHATRAGLKPAPTSHRAFPTTKMPSHLHNRICETPH